MTEIPEHLRKRAEEARKKARMLPPFYWAGFSLSGDWR